ncbi:protein-disulfide reductase DsbD domain-containing protein [Pleomorphomonas sp. PLEO]|uniref:protein-disulfide reductase DsbD domain-containing protein n=1 Tax=Pleomorphomonas sp. PLEO TaxID=3239306 RepID=UPI00351E7D80
MRFAFLLPLFGGLPAHASAFEVPPVEARLVVAGGIQDGAYRAALELDLPDGWHTYWRNPGDAGIPPIFDVARSENLKDFTVDYPVPVRRTDGAGTSMIYEGRLLLPIRAVPARLGAPVTLTVRVLYGLCAEVCVPAEADVTARLDPVAAVDPVASNDIAAFQARVPVRVADDRLTIDHVGFDAKAARGSAEVSVADDGHLVDLFVTGPSKWYAASPETVGTTDGRRRFSVALEGPSGATGTDGVELSFVLVEKDHAYEIIRRLDAMAK